MRLAGVEQVRTGLLAALSGKNLHATARKLAALSGYFTGPDVYYNALYRNQAQNDHEQRRREQRGGAGRPASSPTATCSRPTALQAALASVSSSTKLSGLHGVGLAGVAIKSNGKTTRSSSGSNNFTASVGLVVLVTVKNQGSAARATCRSSHLDGARRRHPADLHGHHPDCR